MVNISITQVNNIINKNFDIIKALDNSYDIDIYTTEVKVERGKYHFNINPQNIVPRNLTDTRDLDNLNINIFMHYDMEADDEYQTSWTTLASKGQAIMDALYDKTNFVAGVSTVTIGVDFDNTLIEQDRILSLTYNCEYMIFATR